MSTAAAFQSGLDAVKAGRFAEAIATLEDLCDGKVKPPSKAYYQVKMNLVKAYRGDGQLPKAIKLCRQLSTSSHPQVQQWAQKMLPELRNPASLSSSEAVRPVQQDVGAVAVAERPVVTQANDSPQPVDESVEVQPTAELLDPTVAEELLSKGIQTFRRKQYEDAIAPLRQFVQGADPAHPNLGYAQTSLAKAYKATDRVDDAIALCKTMLETPNEGAKAWAKQFLSKHDIQPEPEVAEADVAAAEAQQDALPAASAQPSTYPTDKSRQSDSNGPTQKDHSVPIVSAACYASYYFGLIYSVLFPSSVYGGGPMMLSSVGALLFIGMNWLGPIIVSVTVLSLSKNRVARANAKEAINLWITSVVIGAGTGVLLLGLFLFPLLAILALLLLIPVGIIFYVAPLIALIMCVARPFEPFRIPLIWHIVK